MSTWLDDVKKDDPELAYAFGIVGNQSTEALQAMVKALGVASWLNTWEDERRLRAARLILSRRRRPKARSVA